MEKNWKDDIRKVNIEKLHLDLKNPRTDNGRMLVEDQVVKELLKEGVLELVKDISTKGYLATSVLMVVVEDGRHVVVDGNRRILSVKILNNPSIVKSYVSDEKFKKLESLAKNKIDSLKSVKVIIYPDRKSADREMAILHLSGIAIQQWKPLRQYRYFYKRVKEDGIPVDELSEIIGIKREGIVRGIRIFQLYDFSDRELPDIKNSKGETIYDDKAFRTDKFSRLLINSPEDGERFLGYSFDYEKAEIAIEDKEVFKERLRRSLVEMYAGDSRYLASAQFKLDDKLRFFNEVVPGFVGGDRYRKALKKEKEASEKGRVPLPGMPRLLNSISDESVVNVPKSDRQPKGLFLKSAVPFKLGNRQLQRLYDELSNSEILRFPNAAHDLLRSFLECSLIAYLKHGNISKYNEVLSLKVKSGSQKNLKLEIVLDYLSDDSLSPIGELSVRKIAKQLISHKEKEYSVERMNMVNHNESWFSMESDVRNAWDKMEPLFKVILNPEKSKK